MNKYLLLLLVIFTGISSYGQGVETFANTPTTSSSSYLQRTWTGDNSLPWTADSARTDLTINGTRAIAFRNLNGNVKCSGIPNGVGSVTFLYQQAFTTAGAELELLINGAPIGSVIVSTAVQTVSFPGLNIAGTFNLEIRNKSTITNSRAIVDSIAWTGFTGSPCTTPTSQPTALSFGTVTSSTISGSFTAASPAPNQYLVLISNSNTLSATPQNGVPYNESDVIGNATVVSAGTQTSFTASSLVAGTPYYFYIFSLNSACTGGPLYNTSSPLTGNISTSTPPVCSAPTTATGAITLSPATTSISGSFGTATGADGYMVVRSSSGAFSFSPANATTYSIGQTLGSGNTGIVIKYGPGTTFSATGLTANTTYYFYTYPVSNFTCTGGPFYNTTATTANATTTLSGGGEPAGYYNNTVGKDCAPLKTALKTIITTGNNLRSYGDLWGQYLVSDIKPREVGPGTSPSVIWDIYSDNPTGPDPYNFTPGGSGIGGQCGNYSNEGDCYNREHSFPQSWFTTGTSTGPGTDYHHIFPTDGKVNALRSSFVFGEVATATTTSLNGSKLGSSSFAGITGTVFEPINEFKGDLARAFLYMVTRYEDNMTSWGALSGSGGLQALEPNTFPSIDIPYIKLMLKWHSQDPVSQKEIDRNNAGFSFQGNRNPFVDRPEFVEMIWNASCPGLSALPVDIVLFGGKLYGNEVLLKWTIKNETNLARYEVERSFNGTSFTKIGTVQASGISEYDFTDNVSNTSGRRIYYRLKNIDKDGKFKYSDVFTLHVPLNTKFTISPNPAGSYFQIKLNYAGNEKVSIQVLDITGKMISKQEAVANSNIITMSTTNISNGNYLVRVIINGAEFIQRLVVAK